MFSIDLSPFVSVSSIIDSAVLAIVGRLMRSTAGQGGPPVLPPPPPTSLSREYSGQGELRIVLQSLPGVNGRSPLDTPSPLARLLCPRRGYEMEVRFGYFASHLLDLVLFTFPPNSKGLIFC